jgi:hypothetical protein
MMGGDDGDGDSDDDDDDGHFGILSLDATCFAISFDGFVHLLKTTHFDLSAQLG